LKESIKIPTNQQSVLLCKVTGTGPIVEPTSKQ